MLKLETFLYIILSAIFLVLLYQHYYIILSPYPMDLREGANLLVTKLILEGHDPFGLAYQPEQTSVYGVMYGLVTALFAKFIGVSFFSHRLISGVAILGSCFILFHWLRYNKVQYIFSLIATLFFYSGLLFFVTAASRPDALGVFFMLSALYIVVAMKFSWVSLLFSSIITVFAFLTKIYFILPLGLISSFLFLFVSKKRALEYVGLFTLVFSIAIAIIYYLSPYYFNNNIVIHLNNIESQASFLWLVVQLKKYVVFNFSIILLLLVSIIWHIQNKKNNITKISFEGWCVLLVLIIFNYKLGLHGGAYMTYMFQLISPFLLLFVMSLSMSLPSSWQLIIKLVLILNLITIVNFSLPKVKYDENYVKQWQRIENWVKHSQFALNSPAMVHLNLKYNKPIVLSGASFYFSHGIVGNKFSGLFTVNDDDISKTYEEYIKRLEYSISHGIYDVIFATKGYQLDLAKTLLMKQYRYIETIPTNMMMYSSNLPWQFWETDIWIKK